MILTVIIRHVRNIYPLGNDSFSLGTRIKTRAALYWTVAIVVGVLVLARMCTC